MISKFWWEHKDNEARIAWMSWEKLGLSKDKGGMGYQDLESFNLALLAKQGWRLMQNPETLVAKVYQQKYFPNESFLNSQLGRNPSYAWRSIWNAKKLLNEWLMWRIGNGRSVKIWGDRWIPSPWSYAIQTPNRNFNKEANVCSLIDEATNWWNFPLIQELFSREESAIICNIPICPQRQQDKLVWVGTKNGVFTIRSAYHMAKDREEDSRRCSSNYDLSHKLWRTVWNVKASTMVKVFLWKASNNILPSKLNLFRKGITMDALCPICGLVEETMEHILWNCESTWDVWAACNNKIQKC